LYGVVLTSLKLLGGQAFRPDPQVEGIYYSWCSTKGNYSAKL